jgi:Cys-tRNA(Pro)/Cys-tRNA(Cys) deacylase
MPTNNVTRFLEARKIPYSAFETPVEKLGAVETAQILGVPLEIVYKTIVLTPQTRPGKPVLAVVPGSGEVDLKRAAAVLGEKKITLPSEREAEQITGLQAGGISPLALLNKGFIILLDDSALQHELIHISGGQRGLNIRLPVQALITLTKARVGKICSP